MEKYLRSQRFTVADKIRSNIKVIGQQVGYPELTFSSNISAWEQVLSRLNISELLHKKRVAF